MDYLGNIISDISQIPAEALDSLLSDGTSQNYVSQLFTEEQNMLLQQSPHQHPQQLHSQLQQPQQQRAQQQSTLQQHPQQSTLQQHPQQQLSHLQHAPQQHTHQLQLHASQQQQQSPHLRQPPPNYQNYFFSQQAMFEQNFPPVSLRSKSIEDQNYPLASPIPGQRPPSASKTTPSPSFSVGNLPPEAHPLQSSPSMHAPPNPIPNSGNSNQRFFHGTSPQAVHPFPQRRSSQNTSCMRSAGQSQGSLSGQDAYNQGLVSKVGGQLQSPKRRAAQNNQDPYSGLPQGLNTFSQSHNLANVTKPDSQRSVGAHLYEPISPPGQIYPLPCNAHGHQVGNHQSAFDRMLTGAHNPTGTSHPSSQPNSFQAHISSQLSQVRTTNSNRSQSKAVSAAPNISSNISTNAYHPFDNSPLSQLHRAAKNVEGCDSHLAGLLSEHTPQAVNNSHIISTLPTSNSTHLNPFPAHSQVASQYLNELSYSRSQMPSNNVWASRNADLNSGTSRATRHPNSSTAISTGSYHSGYPASVPGMNTSRPMDSHSRVRAPGPPNRPMASNKGVASSSHAALSRAAMSSRGAASSSRGAPSTRGAPAPRGASSSQGTSSVRGASSARGTPSFRGTPPSMGGSYLPRGAPPVRGDHTSRGAPLTRGSSVRGSSRGVQHRGNGRVVAGGGISDRDKTHKLDQSRDVTACNPIQWYRLPDTDPTSFQSDIEAMRASITSDPPGLINCNGFQNQTQLFENSPQNQGVREGPGNAVNEKETAKNPRKEPVMNVKQEMMQGLSREKDQLPVYAGTAEPEISNICQSKGASQVAERISKSPSSTVPTSAPTENDNLVNTISSQLISHQSTDIIESPSECISSNQNADGNCDTSGSISSNQPTPVSLTTDLEPESGVLQDRKPVVSARDRVYSLWKAGQVVGRAPVKGRTKAKVSAGSNSSNKMQKGEERANKIIDQSGQHGLSEESNTEMLRNDSSAAGTSQNDKKDLFYVLFHGHKLLCFSSGHGNSVLVCQFQYECFPDKGKGSVSNCINKALRIKKKILEHSSKDSIIKFLRNNGYLKSMLQDEPVHVISLDDARRVYHYIYNISSCSLATCVVEVLNQSVDFDVVISPSKRKVLTQEMKMRIKREKKSLDDERYGRLHNQTNSQRQNGSQANEIESQPAGTEIRTLDRRSVGSGGSEATMVYGQDDSDDVVIVEGPEDPYLLKWDGIQTKTGGVCNTIVGQVRFYLHEDDNYLVVSDLCRILGTTEFMTGIETDNVILYSCSKDILSFLNGINTNFPQLDTGLNCLVKEKDIGVHSTDNEEDSFESSAVPTSLKRPLCKQEVIEDDLECNTSKQQRLSEKTSNVIFEIDKTCVKGSGNVDKQKDIMPSPDSCVSVLSQDGSLSPAVLPQQKDILLPPDRTNQITNNIALSGSGHGHKSKSTTACANSQHSKGSNGEASSISETQATISEKQAANASATPSSSCTVTASNNLLASPDQSRNKVMLATVIDKNSLTSIRKISYSTTDTQPRSLSTEQVEKQNLASRVLGLHRSSSFSTPSLSSPKGPTALKNLVEDDLELSKLHVTSIEGLEEYMSRQSLLREMSILRFKNKTLQETLKCLRDQLKKSKAENEKSGKLMTYYESVIHEITATFKDGDKIEGETSQPSTTLAKQGAVDSTPIVIDDDD